MKLKIFLALIVMTSFVACKPSYKATDKPTSSTAGTVSTTDSMSSSSNKMSSATDSTKMPVVPDSTTMPAVPDSVTTPVAPDSTKMPLVTDSTKIPAVPDSTKMRTTTDSTNISDINKKESTSVPVAATVAVPVAVAVSVPEGTQTAFTKQYPDATNVVWTTYDSLEVVPNDWKMPDWKTMDPKDQVVKFDMKEDNYYAWYDSDGKWVGSSYNMTDHSKLPAPLKTTLKSKYPGYSITNVNRKLQKDKKGYEVELEKEESKLKLLVNSEGKILKVIKVVKEKTN